MKKINLNVFKMWLFTFFLFFSLEGKIETKKPHLSVCAIFRDEAPYLKEWIEFHRLVGVDHFYLYNHLSTDNYLEVLQPYIDNEIVTLTEWNIPYESSDEWYYSVQFTAYKDAMQIGKDSFWMAVIDTDEFLFPTKKTNLKEFLNDYITFGAVSVNWQVFGTSGIEKVLPGQLMIELLTKKAPFSHDMNSHVKSIVRPKLVTDWINPHFPKLKPGCFQCNTQKQIFYGPFSPNSTFGARINHYWARDEHFFYNHKMPRSAHWRSLEEMKRLKTEIDVEEDTEIARFIPELKKQMSIED